MSKIIKIIHKYSQLFIIVGFVFCVCFYILCHYKTDFKDVSSNQFLIAYLGVLLGFALTLFTFIISMVEKISDKIIKDEIILPEIKVRKQEKLSGMLAEVKDNIAFVFFCLLICCIFSIIENIDLPYISITNYREFVTKSLIINSSKLTIFILSLYAIYDIMIVSFTISDLTSIIVPPKK